MKRMMILLGLTLLNLAGYGYLTVMGALVAYGLWFRGIALLDAVSVSLLSVLNPLTASFLGLLVKDEHFTALQTVGAVVIVFAGVAAQIVGIRYRARESKEIQTRAAA